MKKAGVCLLALMLALAVLSGCAAGTGGIPSGCVEREVYRCSDSEKYTEYGRFYFGQGGDELVGAAPGYRVLAAEDVAYLRDCVTGFAGWVAHTDFEASYGFTAAQVDAGDYYVLMTRDGQSNNLGQTYDRYAYFTLYYYDISEGTLYFFHNHTF